MDETWNHPQLGTFSYEIDTWAKLVDAPAFNIFPLDRFADGPPTGRYPLTFECDSEEDLPTPAEVELASTVLANAPALVLNVIHALWDDFNGRGPHSGMWWHGGLDQITEAMTDEGFPEPTRAQDIAAAMRLQAIAVRKSVHGYDKPVVELRFSAAFEEEHGVGILTDGHSILGNGYSCDVTPFDDRNDA